MISNISLFIFIANQEIKKLIAICHDASLEIQYLLPRPPNYNPIEDPCTPHVNSIIRCMREDVNYILRQFTMAIMLKLKWDLS